MRRAASIATAVLVAGMACPDSRTIGAEVQPSRPQAAIEKRDELVRAFCLPHPLFNDASVWRQRVANVPCKENDLCYIRETHDLLKSTTERRPKGQNFLWLSFDEFTIPIFAGGWDEAASGNFEIKTYDNDSFEPSTMPSAPQGGRFRGRGVPRLSGPVRPAGPEGLDADGHLVLYDSAENCEYDFWNATTLLKDNDKTDGGGHMGDAILFAGSAETFKLNGLGAQRLRANCKPLTSSRATGVPLLAGLLVPEDFQQGAAAKIEHALVFSLPKLRHLCPDDDGDVTVPPDFVYPATKTETTQPLQKRYALAAGERIRLKPKGSTLWCEDGGEFDEQAAAPVTQKYLDALREYGAYLVDASGGFTFYAEDYRTANLKLSRADFNELMGRDPDTPLPTEESQWETLMACLQEDLRHIALAVDTGSEFKSNFEVVEDAKPPSGTITQPCTVQQLNDCPD